MATLNQILKDSEISAEAKTIYTYLLQHLDPKENVIYSPEVRIICEDLNFSSSRFYRHRQQLLDKEYLIILNSGAFRKTIYGISNNK